MPLCSTNRLGGLCDPALINFAAEFSHAEKARSWREILGSLACREYAETARSLDPGADTGTAGTRCQWCQSTNRSVTVRRSITALPGLVFGFTLKVYWPGAGNLINPSGRTTKF